MPELAEIETLRLYLLDHIINDTIINYSQMRNNIRYELSPDIKHKVTNTKIIDVRRRAKYLKIYLSNDYVLIYHLGMSGRLTIEPTHHQLRKHDHIIVCLQSGRKLVFNDTRRFGMVYVSQIKELSNQYYFISCGPEPLEENFTCEYLYKKLSNRNIEIKQAIMDNKIVVGVGNIYASESLSMAKIHPTRSANSLTKDEVSSLVMSIREVLIKAIKAGGTTLRDFIGANGEAGYYKQKLSVYGRDGLECYSCNHVIEKIRQSGRTSFFCSNCQK